MELEKRARAAGQCDPRQNACLLNRLANSDSEIENGTLCSLCGQSPSGLESVADGLGKQLAVDQADNLGTIEVNLKQLIDEPVNVSPEISGRDTAGDLKQVGDYRLLREIGRGGMGIVYEAEQMTLGRKVALKVLPQSIFPDETASARFEREASAAAKLHHTNIVPVFESGAEQGVNFYAMQLIDGHPLNVVRDELRKSRLQAKIATQKTGETTKEAPSKSLKKPSDNLDERPADVELPAGARKNHFQFVADIGQQVASALQHAHDRDIVHRDVKPSNLILDDDGVVWLADFGLAKHSDDGLTGTSQAPGTLRYMSPERFQGKAEPVGDVYSLGASLYEMLTLEPAFAADDPLELIEKIKTAQPKSPIACNSSIPLDLQTIVLKAMEKDPQRRYATAAAMADDLNRFRTHQPILARKVGAVERLWLWSKANKGLAASLALVSLLLIGTAVGSTIAAFQINQARADAAESAIESEKSASEAKLSATRKQNIVDSFVTAFGGFDLGTYTGVTHKTSALDVLYRALDEMNENPQISEDPISKASLLYSIGNPLVSLGELERGIECLETVVAIRTEQLGREHDDTIRSMMDLAITYNENQRYDEAVKLYQETLVINLKMHGPNHAETLRSKFHVALSPTGESIPEHEEILQEMRTNLGDAHRYTLFSMTRLGSIYGKFGRHDQAIELLQLAYETRRREVGESHRDTIEGLYRLAESLLYAGRYDEAIEALQTCIEAAKSKFGDFHRNTLQAQDLLAQGLRFKGQYTEAIELCEKVLKDAVGRFDDSDNLILDLRECLGMAYTGSGQFMKALPLYEKICKDQPRLSVKIRLSDIYGRCGRHDDEMRILKEIEKQVEVVPEGHPLKRMYVGRLGRAFWRQKKYDEAAMQYKKSLAIHRKMLSDDHPNLLNEMANLGAAYNMAGKPEQALPMLKDVYERSVKKLGRTHRDTVVRLNNIAYAYKLLKQHDRAIETYLLAIENAADGPLSKNYPLIKNYNLNLAVAYGANGQIDLAIEPMRKAWDLARKHLGPDHPGTHNVAGNYGALFIDAGKYSDGVVVLKGLLKEEAELPIDHEISQMLRNKLADLHFMLGEFEKALPLYELNEQQYSEKLGRDHENALTMVRNIATTLIRNGEYDKAQPVIEGWMATLQSSDQIDEKWLGRAGISLADVFANDGQRADRHQEALELIDTALELDLEPAEQSRGNSLKGQLFALQGKDGAEALLISSVEQLEKIELPVKARWYLPAAMERVVDYFEKSEQPDKAEPWRQRLDELQDKDN